MASDPPWATVTAVGDTSQMSTGMETGDSSGLMRPVSIGFNSHNGTLHYPVAHGAYLPL